ncbi:HD domain-containing phosphohydrolase [Marinitoga aeolica]|uniref:Transporter substrate-binding domain-containing protein n=1 Tax=Marinitoga aeolica TaxID=2809031 RepID=A0ABY8PT30_9BACT|nr:HD domain-containing phosphohydrolase [Marinitoga aeolica]WGS65796.1 transporter substrate-binding domain-containing protein [Marinitoga aeolica]
MKKVIFIILFLIFLTLLNAENLIVGIYENKPLTYKENNEYKGLAIDLLKEIAQKENWHLKYQYDSFPNLIEKIKNNEINILIALGKTKDRELFIKYPSQPFFTNWGVIYSKDNSIDSLLDLKNKKIAVLKNDIYYTHENGIKNLSQKMNLNIEFHEYNSYDEVLKAVRNNICDAGVVNRLYSNNPYNLHKTPIVFLPIEVYYGFSKNIKDDIINKIDYYLNKWKNEEDSVYFSLMRKYIFKDKILIPKWVNKALNTAVIAIITLFISSLTFYILFIKVTKKLKRKNEELEAYNSELTSMNEELEESYMNMEDINFKLIKLTKIMSKLKFSSTFDEFYNDLLRTAIFLIPEADYGSIIFIDSKKNQWKFLSAYGHNFEMLKNITYAAGHTPTKEKIKIIDNIIENEKIEMNEESYKILKAASKPIKQTMIYEIKLKEEQWINFCLDIDINSEKTFSEESKEIFEIFANLARAFWIEKLSYEYTKDTYLNLAKKLASIAEEYDDITGKHIYRVAEFSKFIAKKLNLDGKLIDDIYTYSPLHDIGKLLIDKSILLKKGPLNKNEWEEMKKHTIYGAKILDDPYFTVAKNIALYHHEKYNGEGYPYGLKGDEIPIEAQIVALADVYDALRSNRPYKKGFSHEIAVEIILKGDERTKPEFFNPEILKLFKNSHNEFKKIYNKLNEGMDIL